MRFFTYNIISVLSKKKKMCVDSDCFLMIFNQSINYVIVCLFEKLVVMMNNKMLVMFSL